MRRDVIIVAVLLLAGLAYLSTGRWAGPRLLCQVTGRVLSPPVGAGRWVAWLEGDEKERRLVVTARSGGERRTVLAAAELSGLAVRGETAYVTRSEGNGRAELLEVSLPGGGTKTAAELPEGADQIACAGGWVVWRRSREPGLPGVPFVAAAAPVTVIRARPVGRGPVRVAAVVSGEGSSKEGFDLLGVAGDRAYWLERSAAPNERTWIRRAPCPGGEVETIAEEPGIRSAALEDGVLLWTGPSLEAGSAMSCSSVKRMDVEKGGSEVIADWLGRETVVLLSSGEGYGQEQGSLWRLGGKRGEQRRLSIGPPGLMSGRVIGDEEFIFLRGGAQMALAKRPLSLWSRIRSLAGR